MSDLRFKKPLTTPRNNYRVFIANPNSEEADTIEFEDLAASIIAHPAIQAIGTSRFNKITKYIGNDMVLDLQLPNGAFIAPVGSGLLKIKGLENSEFIELNIGRIADAVPFNFIPGLVQEVSKDTTCDFYVIEVVK